MIHEAIRRADLSRLIPASYLERGRKYRDEGRVRSLTVECEEESRLHLRASVQGTSRQLYRSFVALSLDRNKNLRISGECTCPIETNCKHVAACLLEWRRHGDGGEDSRGSQPLLPSMESMEEPPVEDSDAAAPFGYLDRLLGELSEARALDGGESYPDTVRTRLVYLLEVSETSGRRSVSVRTKAVNLLKGGGFGKSERDFNPEHRNTANPPKFVLASDRMILDSLLRRRSYGRSPKQGYPLDGPDAEWLLKALLATGRCYWRSFRDGDPLREGEPRQGRAAWVKTRDGGQRFDLLIGDDETEDGDDHDAVTVLPLAPPYYVDTAAGTCGPVEAGILPHVAAVLLAAPPIAPGEAAELRRSLEERMGSDLPVLPDAPAHRDERRVDPKPVLRLHRDAVPKANYFAGWVSADERYQDMALAALTFDYGDVNVEVESSRQVFEWLEGETLVSVRREPKIETEAKKLLAQWGFQPLSRMRELRPGPERRSVQTLDTNAYEDPMFAWLDFCHHGIPDLEAAGWRVEIAPDFPYRIVEPKSGPDFEIETPSGVDWFGLSLGIEVEGQTLDLLAVFNRVFDMLPEADADTAVDLLAQEGSFFAPLGDGRFLALEAERIRPLLRALFDLFAGGENASATGLRLDRNRLGELDSLARAAEDSGASVKGAEGLRGLARELVEGVSHPTPLPESFQGSLRGYQQAGLDWLQLLGRHGLGGILADDMGLGKTIQVLAHILVERAAGRLDRPSLLVVPTSLVGNWRAEIARFAPDLKVLVLHGAERDFSGLAGCDLAITTYALLPRDIEELAEMSYHLVILDEAQNIKNPGAKAALAARRLDAHQRLCLTGTPMENHLGELWSLSRIATPGLLGERTAFRKAFRTPIEKHGNEERQALLRRRVRPFLLRRTKDDVARELPAKTEILETVELDKGQRDLYETVRLAMDKRVRERIQRQGLAKSQITILDALLKLRQTCCDPRLVKLESARAIDVSAKLDRLMELLESLLEEGRRVLVFSQFTSMLALIEEVLEHRRVDYVKLTGQTRDRETPVRRFQAGEVGVFLISLKAGGTGLNLTAADVVIHYDPWWNPAVEQQATDRAHRIGQDKPVFVYRLMTRGTVEERMLELQARKKQLTQALYTDEGSSGQALTDEDIEYLLAPLPGAG